MIMQKKLRIGVLMGGKSVEREVSLNSGRTICDHLDTAHYDVVPIFQKQTGELYILPERFVHRGKIADFEHRLSKEAQAIVWDDLQQYIDFAYIAMHGRYAEDGTMQGMLEVLNIPYCGSKVFASALGMDKLMQKYMLEAACIAVPAWRAVLLHELNELELLESEHARGQWCAEKTAGLAYPVIVKPHQEGSSFGIQVAQNVQELSDAIVQAAYVMPERPQAVLIEELIAGMEFTSILIEDSLTGDWLALPATEVIPEKTIFTYEEKYMPGRATKYTPARCSQEIMEKIQATCIRVAQVLEMRTIARIDGFVTRDQKIVIIDPNTFSGTAPSSFAFLQAAQHNMSHTQFINHLIVTELRHYHMQSHMKNLPVNHKEQCSKIRVAVLMGGPSAEKEISLESGRNITYKLSPHKYEAIPLFIDSAMRPYKIDQKLLVCNSTHAIESALKAAQAVPVLWSDLPKIADFVFIGLHGGKGENGALQGMLEMLPIPYNGSSVLTSALCMDKVKTTKFLKSRGFDVPEGILVSRNPWSIGVTCAQLFENRVHYPLIIKPHDDGCSVLVQKAHNDAQLQDALGKIFATRDYALVEECITGTELTVGVIGNHKPQALPPSQVVAQAGILSIEEKFLPGAGENQTPAHLPQQAIAFVQRVMEDTYQALGCKGYSRIDCFYQSATESPTGKERVVIIEVNTLPGMTPATCIFHQAAELGIKPMDFIDMIVTLGFEEHATRKAHVQTDQKIDHIAP